jgi:S-adenosylmethionine-diacylglycerol 3-amino-3-carboxypropyl transferase
LNATVNVSSTGRLKQAVGCKSAMSRQGLSLEGLLEHLFAFAFKGLVYPQIWEDPDIDMEALAIKPDSRVVAIASGGCNILSYLVADPARIIALDLNTAHIALNRLKITASRALPSWDEFFRFFGSADDLRNIELYRQFIRPRLDPATRDYWDSRRYGGLGRRRVGMFTDNFYRYGLLGRCIGFAHAVARAYGVDPRDFLASTSLHQQRRFFESRLAPLFERRFMRWVLSRRASLFGLGIPPAQYASLAAAGEGDMAAVVRERLRHLTCDFALEHNYFAWQAFGRSYGEGPVPPYLRYENFDVLKARSSRIEVLNRSFTEYLQSQPDMSLDRYVLLDAQDWMTNEQLNTLWREITRTARQDARVIFRTADVPTLLPGRVDGAVLAKWDYLEESSQDLTLRDRSAIYGGFHLYVFTG